MPGLDINYQDRDGFTAAILASNKGHTECVRRLAETERVDWNRRNRSGQTPLYWALISVRSSQTDIVNIIVGQPNIDYTVRQGQHSIKVSLLLIIKISEELCEC